MNPLGSYRRGVREDRQVMYSMTDPFPAAFPSLPDAWRLCVAFFDQVRETKMALVRNIETDALWLVYVGGDGQIVLLRQPTEDDKKRLREAGCPGDFLEEVTP